MFDPETVDLIRRAPPLEGLDLAALPQILTDAFTTVVAARIRLRNGSPDTEGSEVAETLTLLTRLATTHEIYVALMPDRENRAAAAFVAASAHQARRLARVGAQPASQINATSISSEISATLLFLIAEAYPDAAEAAKRIVLDDDSVWTTERALLVSLKKLGEGRLGDILSDPLPEGAATVPEDRALEALLDLLLRGVRAMARQLLNTTADDPKVARQLFLRVKALCIDELADPFGDGRAAYSVFSGPLHLANLLIAAERDMGAAALARLPAPPGIDASGWGGMLRRMVRSRPFLWRNHRAAVEEGFLEPGQSATISFPTGAGKSTLAELKIATALLRKQKVVFLAPTHALVSQTAKALQRTFREASVVGDVDEEVALSLELELPEIVVTTPERCLMLLAMQPEAFAGLGLIVFDECHLIHARPDDRSRRGLDSMLCLLNLTQAAPEADLLLLSAMMKNTAEIAAWLKTLTGRDCLSLDLTWKPTRQARGCVVYDMTQLSKLNDQLLAARAAKPTQKSVPVGVKRGLSAAPFGFFSLRQTWNSTNREDYALRSLLETPTLLSTSTGTGTWYLTPNGNEVSTAIAAGSVGAGMKTLVFVQSTTACAKCVRGFAAHLTPQTVTLTDEEAAWRALVVEEMGGAEHCYLAVDDDGKVRGGAASHHALLLANERELHESLFKRKDGIHALFATSTLAQGMNLPSEVVIICGDSRFDPKADKLKQLEAHELLNAAGRAGRAGEGSQGFVLLVPSHVIGFDQAKSLISKNWMDLRAIFQQSDQCLVIEDPLAAALDDIHNGITSTGPAAYLLGRLPVAQTDGGPDPVETMLKRSFVAYSKAQAGDPAWILSRIAAAVAARPPAAAVDVHWLGLVAASTGLSIELLESLLARLDSGALAGSATQAVTGLLAWVRQAPRRLMDLVRPESLEGLFGEAYKKLATDDERALQALELLDKILPIWMSGAPLCKIEAVVEGKTTNLGYCVTARHFATRVAPDLAFVASLPARLLLARFVAASPDEEPEIPAVLATLGSIIREGCDSPETLAARLNAGRTVSRVAARHQYVRALPYLAPSLPNEPFEATLMRVRNAMAVTLFLDLDAGSSEPTEIA